MARQNWDRVGMIGRPMTVEERKEFPDVDGEVPYTGIYGPADRAAAKALPLVRPSVLFVHGEKSPISGSEENESGDNGDEGWWKWWCGTGKG